MALNSYSQNKQYVTVSPIKQTKNAKTTQTTPSKRTSLPISSQLLCITKKDTIFVAGFHNRATDNKNNTTLKHTDILYYLQR